MREISMEFVVHIIHILQTIMKNNIIEITRNIIKIDGISSEYFQYNVRI